MKKITKITVIIAGLAVFFLASCSTSSFMGLSKSKYVESELNGINQSIASIEELETRMVEVERVASDIGSFEEQINQVIQIKDELNASNAVLSTRMDGLPVEVLTGLLNAIQAYLDSLSPTTDTSAAAPAETETPVEPEASENG